MFPISISTPSYTSVSFIGRLKKKFRVFKNIFLKFRKPRVYKGFLFKFFLLKAKALSDASHKRQIRHEIWRKNMGQTAILLDLQRAR
jgi:hypothetical protein